MCITTSLQLLRMESIRNEIISEILEVESQGNYEEADRLHDKLDCLDQEMINCYELDKTFTN